MREIIMGYQGEMSLKGLNRNQFESAMMKIHVHVFFLGLHIKGGLGAVHLELAYRLKAVAQDLHHGCFKLVAVEAFQGHFALIAHNNFLHKCCIS